MGPTGFKLLFLGLMGSGVPVALAMAGASLIYVMASGVAPDFVVIHRMVSGIDSFPLLAVPFFVLAGNLMNSAGITNRIYNFALSLVGWLRGGLGHVNIVGSMVFAGMSGTAIADAAGLGTIEIKAMKDHGYSTEFAVGVTAASATLGPIIPPSLPFVIYAMMANVSVGALFLAGLLPGVLLAVMMMATVAWFAHKNGWGGDIKLEWGRVIRALVELAVVAIWPVALYWLVQAGWNAQAVVIGGLILLFLGDWIFKWQAVLPIMTPVLLIGGMTTGLFTPTEGAIAASVWAMFLGIVWYRTMHWKMFVKVCLDSVETTATVMFIVAAASIFGWMLTATGVTAAIAEWVLGFTNEAWVFLLLANLLMLFVGCFLEPTAAITILVPVLLPIVQQLGIDPVQFGLIMVLNLMIGMITPPIGLNLFIISSIGGVGVIEIFKEAIPYFLILVCVLLIITFIPQLTLFLPSLFFQQ